jgi:transposase
LSASERETVVAWVRGTPDEQGIDADEWTPELLRDHIRSEFGVEYSLGHVRRLLREESNTN